MQQDRHELRGEKFKKPRRYMVVEQRVNHPGHVTHHMVVARLYLFDPKKFDLYEYKAQVMQEGGRAEYYLKIDKSALEIICDHCKRPTIKIHKHGETVQGQ